jgi:hypothetical protein
MEKLTFEIATEMVTALTEGTKFIPQENKTGVTFMAGKQRLVKIVNTKKGLKLEINLALTKATETKLEQSGILQPISKAMAHQKHLGTMQYLYKATDITNLDLIVKDCLKTYNKAIASI